MGGESVERGNETGQTTTFHPVTKNKNCHRVLIPDGSLYTNGTDEIRTRVLLRDRQAC